MMRFSYPSATGLRAARGLSALIPRNASRISTTRCASDRVDGKPFKPVWRTSRIGRHAVWQSEEDNEAEDTQRLDEAQIAKALLEAHQSALEQAREEQESAFGSERVEFVATISRLEAELHAQKEQERSRLRKMHSMLRGAVLDKAFIHTPTEELLQLPVDVLLGVGAKTAKTLGTVGIATVSDLAAWGVHQQAANAMDLEQCASELSVGDLERKALEELRLKTVDDVATFKPALFATSVKAIAEQQPV